MARPRCPYCGHDVENLDEHLGDDPIRSDRVCRRAASMQELRIVSTAENSSYRVLCYETPEHGDLHELEQERFFAVIDKSSDRPLMYFQGWRASRLRRSGEGWEPPGTWLGTRLVELAPNGNGLLVYDGVLEETRPMPIAQAPGLPPEKFPDWITALRALLAYVGPTGWSANGRPGWRAADDIELVIPTDSHTTFVSRALPQQLHLAIVEIHWRSGTVRCCDHDQREGEDVDVREAALPDDWNRALRSVAWPCVAG